MEGLGDTLDDKLCSGLYKGVDEYTVSWSVTEPYTNINCFTCSREDSYWIVPEDQYNEAFENWKGPLNNSFIHVNTLKKKSKIGETY